MAAPGPKADMYSARLDESTRNRIDGCPFVLSVCMQASWKEGNRSQRLGYADGEAGSTPRSFTIGVPEDHVDLPIARLDLRSPSMQDSIDALPPLKTCSLGSPYPRGEEITFSHLRVCWQVV